MRRRWDGSSTPTLGGAPLLTISSASPVRPEAGHDRSPAQAWEDLLDHFGVVFSAPSSRLFVALLTAWALCPGRRTLTRLWSVIPAGRRRCYSSYARWVREGRWSMDGLWIKLVRLLVQHWVPDDRLTLLLDDTLVNKTGRKVEGVGLFFDSVASTALGRTVAAWGLNVVVLALHVPAPWGGEPLALPILVRLHRKDGDKLTALAAAMVRQLTEWLPGHRFLLVADGGYASLVGYDLPRTVVISRLRRNSALYDLTPPRTGRRGRPRLRGERLPTPPELAAAVSNWTSVVLDHRGRPLTRLLWARQVLWWETARARPLLFVVVRDPERRQPDQFFITNDASASPARVVSDYSLRWAIEDTHRNVKQLLGVHTPQSWAGSGPDRVVNLGFWLYSAIWHWYLTFSSLHSLWPLRPWYPGKRTPSFADALSTLRRQLWTHAISASKPSHAQLPEIHASLLAVLAEAA